MTVVLIPFFSSLASEEWTATILEGVATSGATVRSPDELQREKGKRNSSAVDDHHLIFVGTGGTEKAIVSFLSKARLHPPILLLSHDGNNSLPAAMETCTYLQQRDIEARIIHAPLDRLIQRIREWCSYAEVEERIRSSRIGLVGKPSSWLVASLVSPAKVHKRWGLTIQKYPIAALLDHLEEQVPPDSTPSLERFIKHAAKTNVPQGELMRAGTVAEALTRFIRTHKLDAVTVECFTLLQQTDITGCYALSHVNDLESVVAGCEGDVPTTFTLMLAKLLTGRPAFMANVTDVDLDSNSVVFAHCTVATSMVDAYEITTHFESGKSVAIQGRLKAQPVTVLKVLGEDLSRYWVSSGTVIPHQTTATSCRTQVRVKLTEPVSYFLGESLANHHVIVSGNYAQMLSEFFAFALRE